MGQVQSPRLPINVGEARADRLRGALRQATGGTSATATAATAATAGPEAAEGAAGRPFESITRIAPSGGGASEQQLHREILHPGPYSCLFMRSSSLQVLHVVRTSPPTSFLLLQHRGGGHDLCCESLQAGPALSRAEETQKAAQPQPAKEPLHPQVEAAKKASMRHPPVQKTSTKGCGRGHRSPAGPVH